MEDDKQQPEQLTRPYRMQARARSAALTGERILDAAVEVFYEQPVHNISLEDVARRSGVTVQTVIRHYGSKEGLFTAASERESRRITSDRDQAAAGDTAGAIRILLDHYEEVGEGVLRMLAEEHRMPALREIIDRGRDYHRQWCERVFTPALTGRDEIERERRLAQLIAVTDIYTWKLLSRDYGLSREQTELALGELLHPLTGGN
ncbi:TetR/AcrR family transcriptional regulator [Cohnella nanjingensis]|uniref:TetR/AcrR family transcriptional regulator n=1 Tax=Cohnella nanjingensis TaxID=1387779 RepID=A0A7X0RQM2_9BACL|nr:TetR/AcrR family transcriptional regulator [Cohnella nanjingensis]MBB6671868.1 TetR/AcrR family transcriptional regulator [Cohnella nanjingensis]